MKIGDCVFDGSTYVMSIINLTPDSFYDKSRATDGFKSAVDKHISDGADILDIGAQSTRPGYTEVGADEEIKRLEPLWEIIDEITVPVSVDTYWEKTARYALSHGADMINDVWGLKDNGMAECIAEFDAAVCIMHNQTVTEYESILDDMDAYFERALKSAITQKRRLDELIVVSDSEADMKEMVEAISGGASGAVSRAASCVLAVVSERMEQERKTV